MKYIITLLIFIGISLATNGQGRDVKCTEGCNDAYKQVKATKDTLKNVNRDWKKINEELKKRAR